MRRIAFVTTCKGRLHHLKQTLPLLVSGGPDEIIVVDYGCPDGTASWVEENFPDVRVVRVTDDPHFCLSRARNIGAALAESEWLCFIDADILIDRQWVTWLRNSLQDGCFYRVEAVEGERDRNLWGTCVCPKSVFEAVEGYDEVMQGWGGEDDDLYLRFQDFGLIEKYFPAKYTIGIPHGDEERTAFYENKNRFVQQEVNRCYVGVKRLLSDCLGGVDKNLCRRVFNALCRDIPLQSGLRSGSWVVRLSVNTHLGEIDFEMGKKRRFVFFGPRDFFLARR